MPGRYPAVPLQNLVVQTGTDATPVRPTNKTSTKGGASASGSLNPGKVNNPATRDETLSSRTSGVQLTDNNTLKKPLFQMGANLSQQPYMPDVKTGDMKKADVGLYWQTGYIIPYDIPDIGAANTFTPQTTRGNYAFRIHYAPSSVSESTPYSQDYTPSANDIGTNLTAAQATITFQILLNRSEDIYENRTISTGPILGKTLMKDLGTRYDLEWLFRTINGLRADQDPNLSSADIGVLIAYPMQIRLSRALRFPCFLSNITTEHVKFTADMIPMVSLVTIQATRISDVAFTSTTTASDAVTDATKAAVDGLTNLTAEVYK